jgi:hypothetical protein
MREWFGVAGWVLAAGLLGWGWVRHPSAGGATMLPRSTQGRRWRPGSAMGSLGWAASLPARFWKTLAGIGFGAKRA